MCYNLLQSESSPFQNHLPLQIIFPYKSSLLANNLVLQTEMNDGGLLTSSVYIPSQGRLACGRSNGTIIILPAVQCIMLQLLDNRLLNQDSE